MASYEWPPTGGTASGTVTSVSVVSANGFAGSVASPSSAPAITLSTTITGILQGNGTAISAATTGNLTSTPTTNLVVTGGTGAVLGSGALLTLTGASLVEATSAVLTITGATNAVLGTGVSIQVKQASTSVSGYLSSTDWNTFNGKGAGTVTAVSVASTNGFTGTSSGGATPALTLATSITGILQGNGTAISAATTTGSGNVVLATAPTLSNPVVGTQSQGDNSTKSASTAYVDTAVANAVAGINPAVAVQAATTVAGDTSALTYNNGASGIGATFTGTNNTALTVDGFTFTTVGQRLLVKNDTQSPSGAFNGIYNVTQVQTGITPPILTRALDYDQPSDMNNTGAIPVINGTVNGTTQWLMTAQVVTVGTTPLTFVKFSSNPATVGTVTSVTFTGDGTVLSSTPSSAVTTSGTVTGSLLTQSASKALFGPAFGASAATPTFRSPVLNDLSTTVQSKATTYAVLATDDEVICSGASWTATLPAANAAPAGKIFTFIHNDASLARQYTISRAGADTFQGGGTSTTIATQGEILKLQTDGTSVWYVVSRYYPETLLAYTPTVVGFGTITGGSFFYRRLGDSIEVRGSFTNGTVAAALATITLPTGLVLDTTKISAANVTSTVGPTQGEWFNAGTNDFGSMVTATGTSTALVYFGSNTNTTNNLLPNNGNTLAASTTFTTTKFTVPIVGWSG